MKILVLHSDYIRYKPLKKALKNVDEISPVEKTLAGGEVNDALVVLTAVEKSDSVDGVDKVVSKLIEEVQNIAKQVNAKNVVLYPYAHLSKNLSSPEVAVKVLEDAEKKLKKLPEKFNVSRAPFGYYKEFEIKVKGHPLSELSREINFSEGKLNEVKTVSVKREKEKKVVLDRRSLPPNDHRILGEDMKIFAFFDEVGPGLPLWLPNGETIRHELVEFMRKVEEKHGYKYVTTPHITKGHLYEKTGHLPYYADSMYAPIVIEGVDYYLKPMNCPHHHMIFKKIVSSYRDLPLKLAEPGAVYRNELSGVTYGLIRVRMITQNDAHVYVTPDKLAEEFLNVLKLFDEVYSVVKIKDYWFRLSLPDFKGNPDKYTGDPKEWEYACEEIRKAMKKYGKKFVEEKGEAAFYGPKIDVQIKNSLGKEETLATVQIDIVIPKRLNLEYTDKDGSKKNPIIIHRAILGSYERFVAYLLEQSEGRLPTWLSPVQVRVLSFTDRNVSYAEKVIKQIGEEIPDIRIDADFRQTTVPAKVKDAEIMKIPYVIVVGDKEEKELTLAVRVRGGKKIETFKVKDFIKKIQEEISERN